MSNLFQAFAEQWLFWLAAGGGLCGAVFEHVKSRSFGKSVLIFLGGLALGWASVSVPTLRDKVGEAIMWFLNKITFQG